MFKKIKTCLYIYKWFFIKNWFSIKKYPSSNELFKISRLSQDEIEGMLYTIHRLRLRKWYRLADLLRNKLVEIGYYWMMSEKVNTGNLLGHMFKKLEFKTGKTTSLEGYIIGKNGKENLYFSF